MKKNTILVILSLGLFSCNKVFDKQLYSSISTGAWDTEAAGLLYLNNIYSSVMPVFPANATQGANLPGSIHNTPDESSTYNGTILYGQIPDVTYVNDYGTGTGPNGSKAYVNLRTINILLRDIDAGLMPTDAKARIKGQAFFFRAYIYFNLVKLYGGVPYVKTPLDWTSTEVYMPRTATSECFQNIASDLDSAYQFLTQGNAETLLATQSAQNVGRITRGAAKAFKARALLFWASPQFNPNNDQSRWEAAYQANKDAYTTLINDGYALHPDFSKALTDESATNKERIIIRSNDGSNLSGRYNSFEYAARPADAGGGGNGYQPVWDLVRSFLDTNGHEITATNSLYNDTFYWMKRDPRFRATIVWNGSIWELGGVTNRKQYTYVGNATTTTTSTGFYCRKYVVTSTSNSSAAYGSADWCEMRLAEVMLNLAECANYTSRQSEAEQMIIALRQRAGIIAGTDNRYGLSVGLGTAALFNVIMNERRTELAFENKRYDDLRRTKLFTSLNGTKRKRLYVIPIFIPAPDSTHPAISYKDTLLKVVSGTTLVRDTINYWNPNSVRKYFRDSVADYDGTSINFLDKYYYYGIDYNQIRANPALIQTNTWGGTFDPLK